jgi:hypothetical protein
MQRLSDVLRRNVLIKFRETLSFRQGEQAKKYYYMSFFGIEFIPHVIYFQYIYFMLYTECY